MKMNEQEQELKKPPYILSLEEQIKDLGKQTKDLAEIAKAVSKLDQNDSTKWTLEQLAEQKAEAKKSIAFYKSHAKKMAKIVAQTTPEVALKCYLANLQRRINKEDFSGLPGWQKIHLANCGNILPDEMCDEVKVPRGSTVGYSIRRGDHMADLTRY